MYIKQIIIQGFKSYKEQTPLEPFSSGHNVIIGRNGSGKSNFFWAIRFVLGDAFINMDRETRQSLLHEGTGIPILSAYVEIIFDNIDQRFPTGKDQVILRRTIGLKKDEYSLDKKTITKNEVFSLLESAGFSKSNPYYIVPQGRITSLTIAKNSERLQLLKDIAGTKIYEQRRLESLKTMETTDYKKQRINELLININDRLLELEQEKSTLSDFHNKDKERRSLEYFIYSREQNESVLFLNNLDEEHLNEVEISINTQTKLSNIELEIEELESNLLETNHEIETSILERTNYSLKRDELLKIKAKLELLSKDLKNDTNNFNKRRDIIIKELDILNQQKNIKKSELNDLLPNYEKDLSKEKEIEQNLRSIDIKRESLYNKQGRNNQFNNKEDRDNYLNNKIKETEKTLELERKIYLNVNSDINNLKNESKELNNKIDNLKNNINLNKDKIIELNLKYQKLRIDRNNLDEKRNNERLNEHKLLTTSINEELRKFERLMFTIASPSIILGIKSIEYLTEKLNISGVYGPLYKLFNVNDTYISACEAIAGNSLFNIVVDTDETARKLIQLIKQYSTSTTSSKNNNNNNSNKMTEDINIKIGGRVTFIPLNKIKEKNELMLPDDNNNNIPIIQKLNYDIKFDKAIRHVFGNSIVCQSLSSASFAARKFGFIAVTLSGDKADRRGTLTGGFKEIRRSKLEIIKKYKKLIEENDNNNKSINLIRLNIQNFDQEITSIRDKLTLIETEKRSLERSRPIDIENVKLMIRELEGIEQMIDNKEKLLNKSEIEIKNFEDRIKQMYIEIQSSFTISLTKEEENNLKELSIEFENLSNQLSIICQSRISLEQKRNALKIEIDTVIGKRIEDLIVESQNLGKDDTGEQVTINNNEEELNNLTNQINNIEKSTTIKDEEIEKLRKNLKIIQEKIEKSKMEYRKINKEFEKYRLEIEKYVSKRTNLLRRKEEAIRNIRDLGALPEINFDDYESIPIDDLVKRLHKINEDLKVYSHVNKKAFDQYETFTKQRDQLINRKEELDKSAEAIQDLIIDLDRRKDEAILRTFKQVQGYFSEVWEKLVPQGHGKLIMEIDETQGNQENILSQQELDDNNNEDEDEDEDEEDEDYEDYSKRQRSSRRLSKKSNNKKTKKSNNNKFIKVLDTNSEIDKYIGVGINVSFHSKTDEGLLMNQLSGGQKSLVALALIFAIQKCDPAPFYLFDEIDAALDAQYRQSVASMINELSKKAQFITTTFRPELLANADKFYGVTFVGKVSKVISITKEDAVQFVEQAAGLV